MVTPAAKREVALCLVQERQLSQRAPFRAGACNLAGIPTCSVRSCSVRYQSRRQDDMPVRGRLPRSGHVLAIGAWVCCYVEKDIRLISSGCYVCIAKKAWEAFGSKLRTKKRKRIASVQRVRPEATTAVNQMWRTPFGQGFRVGYFELRAAFPWLEHRRLS